MPMLTTDEVKEAILELVDTGYIYGPSHEAVRAETVQKLFGLEGLKFYRECLRNKIKRIADAKETS